MILMTLSSCVKIYSPNIKGSDLNKYVVSGQVTMGDQTQTVNISQTTPISNPSYKPVTGCKVAIQDNEHHSFSMVDLGNGDYSTLVDPKYLVSGHAFRVSVITPDGDSIVSDYDTIQQVPPVDSIYYLVKEQESSIPGQTEKGAQFYINFKGTPADSRYYRWNIYETWEYHAMYPLEYYYDGTLHHVFPPDYSKDTCWRTRKIPEIFTISTANLSQNKYDKLPLQFVLPSKFAYGYSMLVQQLALSKPAYNYWDQLRTNSAQEGGLYEKQPLAIRGNLHDITHPNKEVLGFFSAASASYKRIFITQVPGLAWTDGIAPCAKIGLPAMAGYKAISPSDYPAPIEAFHHQPTDTLLTPICVNCLVMGGTNVKPSFWPK